jgi:signal transduction histidine kinase
VVPIDQTLAGQAIRTRQPTVTQVRPEAPPGVRAQIGSIVGVPLLLQGRAFGAMAVGLPPGARPPTKAQVVRLEAYAALAAVALEFDRIRAELHTLAVSAERERIGRELHEQVIQILFSVGLSLQALEVSANHSETRLALRSAIDDLDGSMRDLRRYVFGLGPSLLIQRPFHVEVEKLARELIQQSGSELELIVDPAVSPLVGDAASHLVQVIREALSNVARHARARHCRLTVGQVDDKIVLEVVDDGRPVHARDGAQESSGGSRRGLENMRARVGEIGGSLEIVGPGRNGTRVVVTLPVPVQAAPQ